jgi:hypothetical protein
VAGKHGHGHLVVEGDLVGLVEMMIRVQVTAVVMHGRLGRRRGNVGILAHDVQEIGQVHVRRRRRGSLGRTGSVEVGRNVDWHGLLDGGLLVLLVKDVNRGGHKHGLRGMDHHLRRELMNVFLVGVEAE